jgi:hypothetical protein
MATTISSLRTDRFIWYVRLIQALFVLVVLGIAAQSSLVWVNDVGCSTPQRLALNIACVSFPFPPSPSSLYPWISLTDFRPSPGRPHPHSPTLLYPHHRTPFPDASLEHLGPNRPGRALPHPLDCRHSHFLGRLRRPVQRLLRSRH